MARKKEVVTRIKNTVIPVAFEQFVQTMEKYGTSKHKSTVSTYTDDNGVFLTIPKQGSTDDKICLFLNKSRDWKPTEEYSDLAFDTWHTGDVRVTVSSSVKAMKQAVRLCKEWKAARAEYTPPKVSGEKTKSKDPSKKEKKAKSNGESKKEKKHKKHKKHAIETTEAITIPQDVPTQAEASA